MANKNDEVGGFGGVPLAPMGIVKGGTASGDYDKEMERRRVSAELRRAEQDRMHQLGRRGLRPGEAAHLASLRLMDQGTPGLVLYYMNRDKTVRQECKSEITLIPNPDRPGELEGMFTLVCPRCLERRLPSGECQIMVRESHRKFWLDERRKGEVVVLYPLDDDPFQVILAGTVSCRDVIRCDNYNCTWAVRVENSRVWEV